MAEDKILNNDNVIVKGNFEATGDITATGGINGLTLSNGISGNNFNISGVNQLTINDPGEGIVFSGTTNLSLAVVDDASDNILNLTGTNAVLQVGGLKVATESYVTTQNYLTSVAFSDLTSTPSTLSGYGINDAVSLGADNVFTGDNEFEGDLLRTNQRINSNQEYPLGHYTPGETVFELDPTWSNRELREYFSNSNVSWDDVANAPGGYAVYINGAVSVGGAYSSGFPYIPIDEDGIYYMECWIKNAGTAQGHYMGSIDYTADFTAPTSGSGNPGSYGYWVMSNYTSAAEWTKVSGYITGHHNNTSGFFETDATYWTPQALFNYSAGSGTRACWISGWKVIRVDHVGDRTFQDKVTFKDEVNFDTSAGTTNTHAKIVYGQSPSPDGSLNGMTQVANYGADGYGLLLHVGYGESDNGGLKITDDGVMVWGASDENVFTVIDEDGRSEKFRIDNSGNTTISGNLTTSGYLTNNGGAKINVQNQQDGGTGRGIYMWDDTDTNWVIYMAQAGDGKAADGGSAVGGIDGTTQHAIRFRVNDNGSQSGFIWENSNDEALMQVTGDTGDVYARSAIYPSNQTTDFVNSTRIQNWQTAYGWGNHGSAGYLTTETYTGTVTSVTVGTGLDVSNGTTTPSITLDLSELTDMTASVNTSQDELILLDNGAERRKLFSEIFGSAAYSNTSAFAAASHNHDSSYPAKSDSYISLFSNQWQDTPEAKYVTIALPYMSGSGSSGYYIFDVFGYRDIGSMDSLVNYRVYAHVRSNGTEENDVKFHVYTLHEAASEEFEFAYKVNAGSTTSVYIFIEEDYSGLEIFGIPVTEGSLNLTTSGMISISETAPTGTTEIVRQVAHPKVDSVAGTYGNTANGTKIDTITIDENGHVTNVATGATGNMTGFFVEDGDGTEVQINNANEWKFVEGTGIDINWTDTNTGNDSDPYDLTFAIKNNSIGIDQLNVTDGTNGQVLTTNGSGTLSFATVTSGTSYGWSLNGTDIESGDSISLAGGLSLSGSNGSYTLTQTDTTTNYYVNGLSFDTATGILTASVNGATNQTVDLDGRYLEKTYRNNFTRLGYGNSGSTRYHKLVTIRVDSSYDDYNATFEWTGRYSQGMAGIHVHSDNDTTADVLGAWYEDWNPDQKLTGNGWIKYTQSGDTVEVWVKTVGWREFDYILKDSVTEGTPAITWYDESTTTDTATEPSNLNSFANNNHFDAGYLTAHPSITEASSNLSNSGRTYIQSITLDSNGHVTGVSTGTETVTNTDTNTVTSVGVSGSEVTGTVTIAASGAASVSQSGNTVTISATDTDTVYVHPTGAGNKHIPSGGAAGQFLKYSSSGTAVWATPSYTTNTDTTYSAGSGLDLTSTTFSVEADLRDGITHVGKDGNNYIQFDSTNGRIDFYAGGTFVARLESDGDLHVKGDVIAFSDIFS